jgi:hypothetical protein
MVRVFSLSEVLPDLAGVAGETLSIDRYGRDEEGVRGELQAWAAWLETQSGNPHHQRLMQHMTSTQQVFTISGPGDDTLGIAVGQLLATRTDGIYQVDGMGFFTPSGSFLLPDD